MMLLETNQTVIEILKELHKENEAIMAATKSKPWWEIIAPGVYVVIGAIISFVTQFFLYKRTKKDRNREDLSKLYSSFGVSHLTPTAGLMHYAELFVEIVACNSRLRKYRGMLIDKEGDVNELNKKIQEEEFKVKDFQKRERAASDKFIADRDVCMSILYQIDIRVNDSILSGFIDEFSKLSPIQLFTVDKIDVMKMSEPETYSNAQVKAMQLGLKCSELSQKTMSRIKLLIA